MNERNRPVFIAAGAVAVALAFILVGLSLTSARGRGTVTPGLGAETPAPGAAGTTPATGIGSGAPGTALGRPEAPVLMEEFSDFQCPFCGRFARETARRIIDEYVVPGKVRFVYRHFSFIGQESLWAAEASECAADQGRFWEYHDKLFANQAGENRGAFSKDNLKRFAGELGLDRRAFDVCLDEDRTQSRVRADFDEAQRRGVRSTPAFFIAGEQVLGALPFESYKTVIDKHLPR